MLYVECYADARLMREVGVPRSCLRHEGGKGNILKRLRRLEAGTGLVDEDKEGFQFGELKNYRELDRAAGLVLLTHAGNAARRIIVVCPRLGDWLLARAKECGLNPAEFGLPADAHRLHSIPRYDRKPGFVDFVKQLKARDPAVQRLAEWVSKP